MRHEWWVIREFGTRYWIAYLLVRIAHKVKDTTYHQIVRIPGGSRVDIMADAWGGGVQGTVCVHWNGDEDNDDRDWPLLRDFDDFDAALDWMHEGDTE